ncbi:hypothetical protein [Marinimicrobium agarilyticum]|uniref:hypothetical protein n=1 Tax=Marinimicrobium agarilyticum TaxID=306546 RepID=UPI0003F76816|nr:hypothetical protein [Marinimicrobium agarilyticum]
MERKEPTISGSIKPEKDEVTARQRSQQPPTGGSGPKGPRRGGPGAPPPSGRPPQPASGGNGLAMAALVVALIGVAGGGFLGWKWVEAEKNLTQANQRLETLEKRIAITSSESSEYVDQIQEKLEWADSEIRKLWGVSYDTNRKNISANTEAVKSLRSELSSVKQTASNAEQAVGQLRSALNETQSQLSGVNETIEQLRQAAGSLKEQGTRLQNLAEEVDQLESRLGQLSGLAGRVETNEEAIKAIDAYRRSINRDILAIKEQLSGASSP